MSIQLNNKDYEVINVGIEQFVKYHKYSKLFICDSTFFDMARCEFNSKECVESYKNNIYGNKYELDSLIYFKLMNDFYLKNISRNQVKMNRLKFKNIFSINSYDFFSLSISYNFYIKYKHYFKGLPGVDFLSGKAIERYGNKNIFIFLSSPAIYNNYAFVKYYYFIPDEENFYFHAIYFKKVNNKWVILN